MSRLECLTGSKCTAIYIDLIGYSAEGTVVYSIIIGQFCHRYYSIIQIGNTRIFINTIESHISRTILRKRSITSNCLTAESIVQRIIVEGYAGRIDITHNIDGCLSGIVIELYDITRNESTGIVSALEVLCCIKIPVSINATIPYQAGCIA